MLEFLVTDAVTLVRRNMDELDRNGSAMYDGSALPEFTDNDSLDNTIKRLLPDAINLVHRAAPVALLEGESVNASVLDLLSVEDGVFTFRVGVGAMLRLVSFKMKDSPIVVTDIIPEASPEGRKQLNRHIRGTYDRPRLVRKQGTPSNNPILKYYCLADGTVPEVALEDNTLYIEKGDYLLVYEYTLTYPGGSDHGTSAEVVSILGADYFVIPIPSEWSGDNFHIEIKLNGADGDEYAANFIAGEPIIGAFNETSGIDELTLADIMGEWVVDNNIDSFEIIKEQLYGSTLTSYNISTPLRQNIVDYLTALVLEAYVDQRAQAFYTKAMAFKIQ